MLVIRFLRTGKKNQPNFKIVVTEKRNPPRAGRFVEQVGSYNPLTKEKVLKQDRIKYWISVGAQPSDTVRNLLISEKIIEGKKIDVHKKSKKPAEEKMTEAKPPSSEAPLEEPKKEAAPATDEKTTEAKPPSTDTTKEESKPEEKSTKVKPSQEQSPKTSKEEPKKEETKEKPAERSPKSE